MPNDPKKDAFDTLRLIEGVRALVSTLGSVGTWLPTIYERISETVGFIIVPYRIYLNTGTGTQPVLGQGQWGRYNGQAQGG
jgi:hypothetical protein